MIAGRALLFLLLPALASASETVETWTVADHPAWFDRRITAFTRPRAELDLAPLVGGRLIECGLEAGEVVGDDAGPALLLDDEAGRVELRRAQARRRAAAAGLRRHDAAMAAAGADRDHFAAEAERAEHLAEEGRLSDRDRDAAFHAAERAAHRLEEADAAREVAAADLATAEAALAAAELRLRRHRVAAPAGWTAVERLAEPGTVLDPGRAALRLADLRVLRVVVRLAEDELRALGRAADLAFPQHPDQEPVRSALHHVDRRFDPATRKRAVELRLPGDAAPAASGGLEVELRLRVPDPDARYVPGDFLIERQEQLFVILVEGQRTPVTPLRGLDDGIAIAADALPDDAVLRRLRR